MHFYSTFITETASNNNYDVYELCLILLNTNIVLTLPSYRRSNKHLLLFCMSYFTSLYYTEVGPLYTEYDCHTKCQQRFILYYLG